MTRSRTSSSRELYGYLGSSRFTASTLREWNARFRLQHLDASMDRYPCTHSTIPERLSEMVHFDRRGYIVAPSLQRTIVAFMDSLTPEAQERGMVDVIVQRNGIITGAYLHGIPEGIISLWQIPGFTGKIAP